MVRLDSTHCRRPPIRRLLARRDGDAVDDEPDALAYAQAEAVQLPMSLAEPPPRTSASRRRCAFLDGFSLHADTSVDAADRSALERLVRYVLRPLISADRLTASMRLARRLDWAALLRRGFGDDVTQCPRCGDALRVLAFITDLRVTAHILEHLGLRSDLVPITPARAPPSPPHPELDFG